MGDHSRRRKRKHTSGEKTKNIIEKDEEELEKETKITKTIDPDLFSNVYIPPHKRKEAEKREKLVPYSKEYQEKAWAALRASINVCINKADATNLKELIVDLFRENLVWGKGLLCRTLIRSQMAAPGYSNVLSAIASAINSKLPDVGELLVKRVITQFQKAYRRNDKTRMESIVVFFAHLVNHYVLSELSALELFSLLLDKPTDDSVDVAITMLKQCGQRLMDLVPNGVRALFEIFRKIVNEGKVGKRFQYNIEGLYSVYRDRFSEYPAIISSLDLIDEQDVIVHDLSIKDRHDTEDILDVFIPMPEKEFSDLVKMYEEIKNDILYADSDEESGNSNEEESQEVEGGEKGDAEEEDGKEDEGRRQSLSISDHTEADLVSLRKNVYLTIMSSLNFEEAVHKIMKLQTKESEWPVVAEMIIDCCANERTFNKDYGNIGERLCKICHGYADAFDDLFGKQYLKIHRYETNKLRNIASFFAHLIHTEAIAWDVLEYIKLTESDTTSSSRIYIKKLFQDLASHRGLDSLKKKVEEEGLRQQLAGIFPTDKLKDTRFAINFFTTIGLGALTTQLRKHLEEMQNRIRINKTKELDETSSSDESSDSSDDSSDDGSSSSSGSEDSSDDSNSENEGSDDDDESSDDESSDEEGSSENAASDDSSDDSSASETHSSSQRKSDDESRDS